QDRGPHGKADDGQRVEQLGIAQVGNDVRDDGGDKNEHDDEDARPLDAQARGSVLDDRGIALLLDGGRYAADDEGDAGGDEGLDHAQGADAVDPHHGGGGVADHAARASGIGRGDDGGEKADMHLAPEHL